MPDDWSAPSMRVKDAKMFTHKQLTLLAASVVVAAGLIPAQPARALTVIAQSYLVSSWDGVNAVKPIGQRRCYTYRDGRRVHRPCGSRGYHRPKRKSGSHGNTQSSSSNKPWGGYEPCANCPTAR
jgi:hypothetical protein